MSNLQSLYSLKWHLDCVVEIRGNHATFNLGPVQSTSGDSAGGFNEACTMRRFHSTQLQHRRRALALLVGFAILQLLAIAGRASAQPFDRDTESPAAAAASYGAFLPLSAAAGYGRWAVLARMLVGYDNALRSTTMETSAEVHVLEQMALRLGATYAGRYGAARPTIGARVQLLRQDAVGLDLALGALYRPEGFTQSEGELEGLLAVGRRFDRLLLLSNLTYGQDPEARERDLEVAMAGLYTLASRWQVGLDARVRLDVSQTGYMDRSRGDARADVVAGPVLNVVAGPIGFFAQAGLSSVMHTNWRLGASGSLGIAAAL